jgi:hypothetical protein
MKPPRGLAFQSLVLAQSGRFGSGNKLFRLPLIRAWAGVPSAVAVGVTDLFGSSATT